MCIGGELLIQTDVKHLMDEIRPIVFPLLLTTTVTPLTDSVEPKTFEARGKPLLFSPSPGAAEDTSVSTEEESVRALERRRGWWSSGLSAPPRSTCDFLLIF